MKHVFLGSLPIGTEFTHKGKKYIKTDDEHAKCIRDNINWVMVPHYGAVITSTQYIELGLTDKDERKDTQ